ncbi:hypothetical protein [Paracoccus mutanolyticus]|uniref:hypothetical protein n=1 Tax=Paracoccus mutanolyticus TaxID=1499308 RepID=UPI0011AE59E5|nr:hypothetical protein [Paracoccus mutanolyticus]
MMKIKMVGEVFEAIPETAAELEYLLTSARRDRHCFGQGDMPSVKSYFGSRLRSTCLLVSAISALPVSTTARVER